MPKSFSTRFGGKAIRRKVKQSPQQVEQPLQIHQAMRLTTYNQMSREKVAHSLYNGAGIMKMLCGITNNASYYVMMIAIDEIKKTPLYKHKVKHSYKLALDAWKAFEHRLVHTSHNRMFHVADMTDEVMKKYRDDLTDAEYYEYWQSTGGEAYALSKTDINVLRHKYKLSLEKHDVVYADAMSWVLTAMACFELSRDMYRMAIQEVMVSSHIPEDILNECYSSFKIDSVADAWSKAMYSTCNINYDLDQFEDRNIALAITQLNDKWRDTDFLYQCLFQATEAYPEVFRTKGEWKKTLRLISMAKHDADALYEELKHQKKDEL